MTHFTFLFFFFFRLHQQLKSKFVFSSVTHVCCRFFERIVRATLRSIWRPTRDTWTWSISFSNEVPPLMWVHGTTRVKRPYTAQPSESLKRSRGSSSNTVLTRGPKTTPEKLRQTPHHPTGPSCTHHNLQPTAYSLQPTTASLCPNSAKLFLLLYSCRLSTTRHGVSAGSPTAVEIDIVPLL